MGYHVHRCDLCGFDGQGGGTDASKQLMLMIKKLETHWIPPRHRAAYQFVFLKDIFGLFAPFMDRTAEELRERQ